MTTFTTLSDATLSQEKPVTQSMTRAFRDNPLAIAEGSSGSPVIAGLNPTDKVTVSSPVAQIVFTNIPDVELVEFEMIGVLPSANSVTLRMEFSSNNGSSWIASSYYFAKTISSLTTVSGEGVAAAAAIDLSKAGAMITSGNSHTAGVLKLFNPGSATIQKTAIWHLHHFDGSSNINNVSGSVNAFLATTPINAVRFYFSSGNISAGQITMRPLRSKVAN